MVEVKPPSMLKNLKSRAITGIAIAILVILSLCNSSTACVLLGVIMILAAFEWQNITKNKSVVWTLFGVVIILLPSFSLCKIYAKEDGLAILIWLLVTISSIDTFAYFAGKMIKGPKLIPIISPGKTWAGLIAAALVSSGCGIALPFIFTAMPISESLIIGFSFALVAQSGDLLESWVKRKFGIKDSGNILPGHGGILDRIDSYITAAPYMLFITTLYATQ